jgi:hypothetical protein
MIIVLNSNRTLVIRMTEVNDSNDFNPEITRNLKSLSRRVDRLEYSQISPQEFSRAFERVYDELMHWKILSISGSIGLKVKFKN